MIRKISIAMASAMALLAPLASSAQSNLTPMMRELPQRTHYNPALEVTTDHYFVLPGLGGISVAAENSGFSFGDLFARGTDDSLHLDLDHLADNMRRRNLTSVNVNLPIFAVGIRAGERNHVSVALTNKTMADMIMPRSVLDFRYGNYDYDSQRPVNTSVSDVFIRAINYSEFAIGFDRWLTENFRAGARVKILIGTMAAQSDDLRLRVHTVQDEEMRSRLEVSSSGSVLASAPIDVEIGDDGFVESVEMQDDLKFSTFKIGQNKGFALDLGATLKMWDLVTLGASITDLGFINWKSNPHQFRAGQSYTFRGINMQDQIKESTREDGKDNYWEEMRDSLERFTDVSHRAQSFKTPLGGSLNLTGEMDLAEWLSVGGLARFRAVGGKIFSLGSLSAQARPAKWASFAISANLEHGARPSLGTAIILTGGAFQFFAIADRIPLRMVEAKGAAISLGINFVIGHRNYTRWRPAGGADVVSFED